MKKVLLILITITASTIFSGTGWVSTGSGNIGVNHVVWISNATQGFYASNFARPSECSGTGSLYQIKPGVDETTKNQILSILLTAKTTGAKLNVHYDGCSSSGNTVYFTGLQLND